MKRVALILAAALLLAVSCEKTEKGFAKLTVALECDGTPLVQEGIPVLLSSLTAATEYTEPTGPDGKAVFSVPAGVYKATVSFELFNGLNTDIVVPETGNVECKVSLVKSEPGRVLIKELYFGGCKDDDGKDFINDGYVVLYNNGATPVDISDVSFAFSMPYNSFGINNYIRDGKLFYEAEGWLPAGQAVWWFQEGQKVELAPYSSLTISIFGAIDHSATITNSVDLSHADYCMYDPDVFNFAKKYPTPSASIPASHYLKTYKYAPGTAWTLSVSSPAFYLIEKKDIRTFVKDETKYDLMFPKLPTVKIPIENVIDGVEVFDATKQDKNFKRLPAVIDVGHVDCTNKNGYTVYRNVDKEATERLIGNKEKLVYGYALGTEALPGGSTDSSGIDAEASIAQGAVIIFKDTNNSTSDFHQRARSSLKK